ncbi:hypothetical protein ADK67_13735 [Saccharothrix sp. NRRL B-16348]|nr:hypothetical protein ADK67_13735 [Saccharothrix sp. NRRL B-16348]
MAVVATGLLLAACGGGGGVAGKTPTPPTAPSVKSMEEVKAANIEAWKACDMFADHVRELAEFLDYQKFADDLLSTNGQNTAGVRLCEGRALFYEDPKHRSNNAEGLISIGFGTANMEGHLYHDEKYKTPTGRYDLMLQLMRDVYEDEAGSLAERTLDGPWEKATVILGDTGTGTTLSAFVVDTKRDFMLRMTFGGLRMKHHGDKLTWDWEKASKHFREVTMVNAYQAMADRIDHPLDYPR